MSGFVLSPGITPELAEAFVVELPLALALGAIGDGRRGLWTALGVNAALLGAIKLVTDYSDPLDVPVAFSGLL